MITPIKWVPKEAQERLNKKIREMWYDGLVKHFLEQGWCKESAESLADSMLKSSKLTTESEK